MKVSEFIAPKTSRIVEQPIPEVGDNDVLIKVVLCGVCGSELHRWQYGDSSYPQYFGHEAVGCVIRTGKNVTKFKEGDRVTGLFEYAFAEYAKVDQARVVKIPDSVEDVEALGEPISCIVSGVRRVNVDLSKIIAIIGVGFMGLMTLQLMRLRGAGKIIAIDNREDMLEVANKFGADEVYKPEEVPEEYKLYDMNGTTGVDIVIECTGNEQALNMAIEMLKNHAILSIVGFHQGENRKVNFEMLNWKAGDMINAHERRKDEQIKCMEIGMKLLENKQLDIKSMVTHRYSLEEVDKAFGDFTNKIPGFDKSIIEF